MIDRILALLPMVLSFLEGIIVASNKRDWIADGRLQEIAQASQRLNATLARASSVRQEAAEAHAKDDTDTAFDPEFRRD